MVALSLEAFKVRLDGALSADGAVGVTVQCRGVGPDGLCRSLPTQTILCLYVVTLGVTKTSTAAQPV